jgi:lyso-ornithine lipid O-acyltransferase
MSNVRGFAVLALFFAFTLPLMPLQLLFVLTGSPYARSFPNWYHRWVCRIVGLRLHVQGGVARGRGVLLIANHVSWLDIAVLSALAPVSFVAKSEVGTWPFVSWLARLQRSIFIDRQKRTDVTGKADEIVSRLAAGDNIVLFAEGTSSDGNTVLPFKSSLFAAVKPSDGAVPGGLCAQTVALSYTRIYGLPIGRGRRHLIGWYGDMEMGSHGWRLLGLGPLDVAVRIGEPVPLDGFADRKQLARYAETKVRSDVIALARGRTGNPASGALPGPAQA